MISLLLDRRIHIGNAGFDITSRSNGMSKVEDVLAAISVVVSALSSVDPSVLITVVSVTALCVIAKVASKGE